LFIHIKAKDKFLKLKEELRCHYELPRLSFKKEEYKKI